MVLDSEEGDTVEKKRHACWFSPSSWLSSLPPMRLLLVVVPLVVVSVLVAVLGPTGTTGRELFSGHPWLWRDRDIGDKISYYKEELTEEHGSNSGSVVAVEGGVGKSLDKSKDVLPDDSVLVNSPVEEAREIVHPLILQNATAKTDDDLSPILENGSAVSAPAPSPIYEEPVNLSKNTKIQERDPNLKRIEASLRKSRASIKDASTNGNQTQDPDYVPLGPMYWNANAFHRSYLEMESRFKVFVYEEGEPPVFHNGPCRSIYSMEGNFIHMMEVQGQFRIRDPEKAHAFFLPFSVAKMVQFVYVPNSHDFGPIRRTVKDYVNLVALRYRYWNRSLGADHFILACHDWGPEASFSEPHLGKNSIRALCNANTSEKFNPMKDISIPEINLRTGSIQGFVGGPSASKRPILAFFAGGLHGPIRPILLEHWENKDNDIKVHRYLPKGVSYIDMMKKSKFCICPSGYEVASPRIVEAFYVGCVPVLISDHYVPPFSDVLNWKSFSVEVPVSEIPNLKHILTSISTRQYIRMYRRVQQVRRHFEVNYPPKRFDVFHMILHSVWLRRMNFKVDGDARQYLN